MSISFDYDRFFTLVRDGAREAFEIARRRLGDQTIYGYGLGSDNDAMTICDMVNTEESLAEATKDLFGPSHESEVAPADAEFCRFSLDEWSYQEGLSALQPAQDMLSEHYRARVTETTPGTDESLNASSAFADGVFDSCVRALEALIAEGFFGSPKQRANVFIHFSICDSNRFDVLGDAARRLNSKLVASRAIRALCIEE